MSAPAGAAPGGGPAAPFHETPGLPRRELQLDGRQGPPAGPGTDDRLCVAILTGRRRGQLDVLPRGWQEVLLGRDPDADVNFPPDEDGVSRRHALLSRRGGEVWIMDCPGSAGTFVEGCPVGPGGLPLARGAKVRLGHEQRPVWVVIGERERLTTRLPRPLSLRRVDKDIPRIDLGEDVVLGRATGIGLDPVADVMASGQHCRLGTRFGLLVLEDLGSANGTFVAGERVQAVILQQGDEVTLGGRDGPRFVVEAALERLPAAPTPGVHEVARAKFQVRFEGQTGTLFLFAGRQLRFGRNGTVDGKRHNDLVLRAFPRPSEAPPLVAKRTMSISGEHGLFRLDGDTVVVRDNGSKFGTKLDGRDLEPMTEVKLPDSFFLEVAGVIGLRGQIIRRGGRGPVLALRLERTRDGEQHTYILVAQEATIGAGEEDAVFLPHEGVREGHARVQLRGGKLVLTRPRDDAPVAISGLGTLGPGASADLEPGQDVFIGSARLGFSWVLDDDMKPPPA